MVKREVVTKALKEAKKEQDKQIAELKAELADLRKAVTDLLAANPEELWNIEELGEALKPSKVVCLARTKFEKKSETKDHDCRGCHKADECADKCHCENSPALCDACLGFLFQTLNFIASRKEIDMFSFCQEILVGIHIE